MTKQQIMDNYAKEQGYQDWMDLQADHYGTSSQIRHHWEAVIDLVQIELLKEVSSNLILGDTINKIQFKVLNTTIL